MSTESKAQRYRRLALRETNKAIIGLFHRLAGDGWDRVGGHSQLRAA